MSANPSEKRTSGFPWLRTAAAGAIVALAVVYSMSVEPATAQVASTSAAARSDQAEQPEFAPWSGTPPAAEFLPAPTDREQNILTGLQTPISMEFDKTPLAATIAYIKDVLGRTVEFQLDLRALEDAGIGGDTPVTRHVHDIPAASALALMLDELDLTYLIHNDVVLVTTKDKAETVLLTRTYPVSDLAGRKSE